MESIGQLLRSLRLEKHLTIKDISLETKIDSKLIIYLEKDDYTNLPSSTFTKGFITSYSKIVDFPPKKALAIFRRDFDVTQSGRIMPKGFSRPLNKNTFIASKLATYGIISLLIIAFAVYLGFQLKQFNSAPQIDIVRPKSNTVVRGPQISVKGFASANSSVYVNGNIVDIFPTGQFHASVQLPQGDQIINIKAVDQNGKSSEMQIPVTVVDN